MIWKILAGVWLSIAIAIMSTWLAHGSHIFTKDKVQVVTKRLNPTFGVEEEIIEWQPQFRLGLEYAAPSAVLCVIVGIICLRIACRTTQTLPSNLKNQTKTTSRI
ncbi:MAG: hypothetical protein RML40_00325 [Bacteroidota bacterium]|nr:hypothetical protein [Candidatus Kapabacteria bacterium]MDW8218952.1 hypothetical protein [Bacteroidota bacterium]